MTDPVSRPSLSWRGAARPAAPAYAALDLGTNNCRLLIAMPTAQGFRVVDSFSRVVRLGEGLAASGRLSQAAMDRTLNALHVCVDRIGRRRLRGLRAIATEACRRAENGRSFLRRVEHETGLAIEMISTREEAELALESCAPLLRTAPGSGQSRALLFDIGGGSTEIAWVRLDKRSRPELIGYRSLPLGVVTLAEQFGDDAFTEAGYTSMVRFVCDQLRSFEALHCIGREVAAGRVRLIGTSGTVTTLASIALELPRYRRSAVDGIALPSSSALQAAGALRRMGRSGMEAHSCIGPDRARLVLPGCAIFEAIHRRWPCDAVMVADRGLRDGMLLRMMRDRSAQLPMPPFPIPSLSVAAGMVPSA
ncbi:Ppx/GppA family phosphatase [Acetobacteraceae bacterium KSS8]|uniref:Ppx/GppA family phosphatase n=1 Tax=Endosaccharibacter trunci TaxID=2812733 RepID=A0ABT1W340_9PROT|nr:Ppx/GppA family phosphatase [Acetobacteraceae bacterium KSS8]